MSVFPWTSSTLPSGLDNHGVTGDSETLYVAFPQAEYYATPSSLIPTSGSSVSRAAETFTIPSANLPWPTPQYIGSELVTNGTFDTDTTGWTARSGAILSVNSNRLRISLNVTDYAHAVQGFPTTSGKVYRITFNSWGSNQPVRWRLGTSIANNDVYQSANSTGDDVSWDIVFVAQSSTTYVTLYANSTSDTGYAEYDNISVREINPLSVSIAMDGRMTYADEGALVQNQFFRWKEDNDNLIRAQLDTNSTNEGSIRFRQESATVIDDVSSGDVYAPDVLVPFDIASRHGSTFINGAIDGVALTANTTPTALPDLSATDLDLANDYMGTISVFRVWDRDIGDTGLVEATSPSLEPSLSLTFEGTGTNSFIVNDWSQ
jgi:hypothetical protein